jgi:hypothetical protein
MFDMIVTHEGIIIIAAFAAEDCDRLDMLVSSLHSIS